MDDADERPRRILVTGAASGIGRAVTERLLADGACVAALDLHRFDITGADDRLRSWTGDVSDEGAVVDIVAEATAWLGGLDAVAHVAGIVRGLGTPIDELAREDWDSVLAVNLTGAYLVAKHTVPHLERSRGALVLTGSGAGVHNAHRSAAYAASKGGLHGLAITLEDKLRERGVRVYDVLPGAVDTPLVRAQAGDERVDAGRQSGRIIDAAGVAAIIAFLVSAEAVAVRGSIRTW